ncbi:hypothetical protein PGT21_021096 [Puccinia graminis f. sp. tritici]|uniref:Uncharacterized protein n=1 Tax=Puccinia graminis f. sp. tritici TaxID=56615 RepID=A0A5B0LUT5_PUCGR|nr:hypothetical protein PGTUg99_025775 [Puccinia graminis f. sp. tritici]KAA1119288.1 hypothetical protein PGT21_020949 [Puccinia graminis f. sp. tritici]KAA1119290.1 hypothetical protein PGT21_021003 [Puccinia graminis f. sp. tritici]KAA1119292.1 hypothetical protein PGT21_021047 [Puccinia graminis f. sp. tritici]KAA1119294.1 hypothetical protein PGT21_021096 [Puccinia graminis f. sp. tritici]
MERKSKPLTLPSASSCQLLKANQAGLRLVYTLSKEEASTLLVTYHYSAMPKDVRSLKSGQEQLKPLHALGLPEPTCLTISPPIATPLCVGHRHKESQLDDRKAGVSTWIQFQFSCR